jgi:hypothetical protein
MIPSITISAVVSVTSKAASAAAGKLELQVEGMAQFIFIRTQWPGGFKCDLTTAFAGVLNHNSHRVAHTKAAVRACPAA